MTGVPQMTKALTLDEAREVVEEARSAYANWLNERGASAIDALREPAFIETLARAIARQEIAALSDGDRTRAEDAQVGPGLGDGEETAIEAIMRSAFGDDWRADARVLIACRDITALIDGICLGHDNQMRRVVSSRDATIADLRPQLDKKDRRIEAATKIIRTGRDLYSTYGLVAGRPDAGGWAVSCDDFLREADAALSQDKEGSS